MPARIASNTSRVAIFLVLTLLGVSCPEKPVQASGGVSNFRINNQSAFFTFDDGTQYAFLSVEQDELANTTSLSFAHVFPDPNDPNLTIYILGDEGEIANSAFNMDSNSAHLIVTTPDSLSVNRCAVNNETGEYTCEPTGPRTFDLTWLRDDSWSFRETSTSVETFGQIMTSNRSRFEEVQAKVSGTWDDLTFTDVFGYLSYGHSSALLREARLETRSYLATPLALEWRAEETGAPTSKLNLREAYSFLYGNNLFGFMRVWQDEFTKTTTLRFGYAYPDETDPSRTLFYQGQGEIPKDSLTITSVSASLSVTTSESFFIIHCIITDVIGNPGAFTCEPATTPVTFNLTWKRDGYGSTFQTATSFEVTGPLTTMSRREFNRWTTIATGTWSDAVQHSGTDMTGFLFHGKNLTTNP